MTLEGKKLLLFRVLALSIPIVFLLLLELSLRAFNYGDDLRLFIPPAEEYADLELLMINPDVVRRYFPRHGYAPLPAHELFLRKKPENGYRIFVLGESTTAGYPYPNNVMFSRVLAQRLSDTFPERHIEVINTGIAAVNSYTLLDFLDEILAQNPDAILIYAGHNEFYGVLGAASSEAVGRTPWVVRTYLSLMRLKLMQLLRNLPGDVRAWLRRAENSEEDRFPTLMGRMIGDHHIPYGGEVYQRGKRQFRENLGEILRRAQAAGVPVVLSELVSNLRDHPPFVSIHDGDHPPAQVIYDWGRTLERQGMPELARLAYYRAKDLDGMRFRAPEDFNHIIHRAAAEFSASVVPMQAYFEDASPGGIIGNKLMLEHLHPNVEGYLLMADAYFDTLRREGYIADEWDEDRIPPASHYLEHWPISAMDRRLGEVRVEHLTSHWPFRPLEESGKTSLRDREPRDFIDEMAIKVATDEIGFRQAHIEVARYYEEQGAPELALLQYRALISSAPYDATGYLLAANHLLDHREFDRALSYLHESLKLKNTPIANQWIGRILLVERRPEAALPYLEQAATLRVEPQVLYYLSGAYLLTGQDERARARLAELKRLEPDFPGIESLERQLNAGG